MDSQENVNLLLILKVVSELQETAVKQSKDVNELKSTVA